MPLINENGELAEFIPADQILASDFAPSAENFHFDNHTIIGIEFPSHSDGRGFTIAKKLRRLGFSGRLRAIGPVIPDQFADLIACGFNEIEISEEQFLRQPLDQWRQALGQYSNSYQSKNGAKISILEARHNRGKY